MGKKIAIITGFIILHIACDAQYSSNKTIYDYHEYSYQMGDPYKPSQMSLASAFIPGLGQFIEGESSRGLAFLGGSIALVTTKWVVIYKTDASYTVKDVIRKSALIGQIALRIWSGINASRIAKVNNLSFRDKYNSTVSLKILPYSGFMDNYRFCKADPVGIALLLSF